MMMNHIWMRVPDMFQSYTAIRDTNVQICMHAMPSILRYDTKIGEILYD